MSRLQHIEIDLNDYKIVLRFQNAKDPLILHFDTPSRKFYLSLIALIVHEMKHQEHSGYVYLRKHEQLLKLMDETLAGSYASATVEGMYEKIRKAWHYSLPNLEEAAHFKIEGRDLVPPYEKGGKFLYDCKENECDGWANLFAIDDITNKWRFRFAFDSAGLGVSDITITFGDLRDDSAWDGFLKHLEKTSAKSLPDTNSESVKPAIRTHPISRQLLVATVGLLIILLVGGATLLNRYLWLAPPPTESVEAEKPSIAILPFINISDDADKDYFCDGITEELTNSLARLKDLRVISRTSAFYFKDKGFDLRTIGEKLGVENILEGSVRISGDKLKISAQLIKVADDSHLWADTYDREMKNIFDIQENLAQEIVCNLKPQLGCRSDEPLTKDYTNNLQAYNLYLKGRALWKNRWSKQSLLNAIEYFEEVIEIDPKYALAYAGLADLYNEIGFYFYQSFQEYHHKAKAAALTALEIDDMLAEAHAALGFNRLVFEWNWKGAEVSCKRAIDLNPSSSVAHKNFSMVLRVTGRIDEAIKEMERSLELDPFSLEKHTQYIVTLRMAGRPKKAINQAIKVLELYPDHPNAITFLGSLYSEIGDFEKGIALLMKAVSITKRESPFALGFLGLAYALSGDTENAKKIRDELIERSNQGGFPPTMISLIYNGLNDKDNAFEWIEKAYNIRDPRLFTIKTIMHYKNLHSDPRWSGLMKKMGLEG